MFRILTNALLNHGWREHLHSGTICQETHQQKVVARLLSIWCVLGLCHSYGALEQMRDDCMLQLHGGCKRKINLFPRIEIFIFLAQLGTFFLSLSFYNISASVSLTYGSDTMTLYMHSMYFILNCLTATGIGDIHANTLREMMATVFMVLILR